MYDDSFVEILGNRFSADTLRNFANKNAQYFNANIAKTLSSSNKGSSSKETEDDVEDKKIDLATYARESSYGESFNNNKWTQIAGEYGMSVEDTKGYFQVRKLADEYNVSETLAYNLLFGKSSAAYEGKKTIDDYIQDAKKLGLIKE